VQVTFNAILFGISYAVSFIMHWMLLLMIILAVHKFMTYAAKTLIPFTKMLIYGLPKNISLLITATLIEHNINNFISRHSVRMNIPVHYTYQSKCICLNRTYNHKCAG
jgi:hypothetical protein